MNYKIKGWDNFQHFKDRRPPWIKLYRDLLDDPDWHNLDGDTAKILVSLWLIASEDKEGKGGLPDTRRIAFRLRISEIKLNKSLAELSHWIQRDDTNEILTEQKNDELVTMAAVEIEEEADAETKKKKETRVQKALLCPPNVSHEVWVDFLELRKAKKAPVTAAAIAGIEREAEKAQWSLENALIECCARGWNGFKAQWVFDKEQEKESRNNWNTVEGWASENFLFDD
mgnify:CR=1 FL=1|jgi:hypothetical protein